MKVTISIVNILAFVTSAVYAATTSTTSKSIVKSASINGFADPIYTDLPDCAKPCVDGDTLFCPYWDTGCLCVIELFADPVAECIASGCTGSDVSVATSLAYSVCASAGADSPYWYIADSLITSLDDAAAKTVEATVTSSSVLTSMTVEASSSPSSSANSPTSRAISSSQESSQETVEYSSSSEIDKSSSSITSQVPSSTTSSTLTTTGIVKSASINGFADPIYTDLPKCAQSCVDVDTLFCPYWDAGCICYIESIADEIADCIAEDCSGSDVSIATSLAYSVCSSAGVDSPYWNIGDAEITALDKAAAGTKTVSTTDSRAVYTASSNTSVSESHVGSSSRRLSSVAPSVTSSVASSSSETYFSTIKPVSKNTTSTESINKSQVTFHSSASSGIDLSSTERASSSNITVVTTFETALVTLTSCSDDDCTNGQKLTTVTKEFKSTSTNCANFSVATINGNSVEASLSGNWTSTIEIEKIVTVTSCDNNGSCFVQTSTGINDQASHETRAFKELDLSTQTYSAATFTSTSTVNTVPRSSSQPQTSVNAKSSTEAANVESVSQVNDAGRVKPGTILSAVLGALFFINP